MNYLLAFALALLLIACGNNKKVETGEDETTEVRTPADEADNPDASSKENKSKSDDSKAYEELTGTKDLDKKLEAMLKLTPLSTDEMKGLLPETISGMPRSKYQINAAGIVTGDATYKSGNEDKIRLTVSDCAGEAGGMVYGTNYFTRLSWQQESDEEYTKRIDLRGAKAVEQFNKKKNEPTLLFMAADRFLVSIHGYNMKPEELRAIAEGLTFAVK